MLMLKVQCYILKCANYEGSRDSYIRILHRAQFHKNLRNSVWNFSCDLCTDTEIWMYPRIISNTHTFMTGKIISALLLKHKSYKSGMDWYFCVYFRYKPFLICIFLFPGCIYCYRRKFLPQYSVQNMISYATS